MTASLAALLEAAGLSGRGGAGFSTAVKVRAAATEGASLVVNACDGEYGAVKDGYVVGYHLKELVRGAE
jgi:NADH:ubiquinone oxidoreductase subunit F (NADH-binding)